MAGASGVSGDLNNALFGPSDSEQPGSDDDAELAAPAPKRPRVELTVTEQSWLTMRTLLLHTAAEMRTRQTNHPNLTVKDDFKKVFERTFHKNGCWGKVQSDVVFEAEVIREPLMALVHLQLREVGVPDAEGEPPPLTAAQQQTLSAKPPGWLASTFQSAPDWDKLVFRVPKREQKNKKDTHYKHLIPPKKKVTQQETLSRWRAVYRMVTDAWKEVSARAPADPAESGWHLVARAYCAWLTLAGKLLPEMQQQQQAAELVDIAAAPVIAGGDADADEAMPQAPAAAAAADAAADAKRVAFLSDKMTTTLTNLMPCLTRERFLRSFHNGGAGFYLTRFVAGGIFEDHAPPATPLHNGKLHMTIAELKAAEHDDQYDGTAGFVLQRALNMVLAKMSSAPVAVKEEQATHAQVVADAVEKASVVGAFNVDAIGPLGLHRLINGLADTERRISTLEQLDGELGAEDTLLVKEVVKAGQCVQAWTTALATLFAHLHTVCHDRLSDYRASLTMHDQSANSDVLRNMAEADHCIASMLRRASEGHENVDASAQAADAAAAAARVATVASKAAEYDPNMTDEQQDALYEKEIEGSEPPPPHEDAPAEHLQQAMQYVDGTHPAYDGYTQLSHQLVVGDDWVARTYRRTRTYEHEPPDKHSGVPHYETECKTFCAELPTDLLRAYHSAVALVHVSTELDSLNERLRARLEGAMTWQHLREANFLHGGQSLQPFAADVGRVPTVRAGADDDVAARNSAEGGDIMDEAFGEGDGAAAEAALFGDPPEASPMDAMDPIFRKELMKAVGYDSLLVGAYTAHADKSTDYHPEDKGVHNSYDKTSEALRTMIADLDRLARGQPCAKEGVTMTAVVHLPQLVEERDGSKGEQHQRLHPNVPTSVATNSGVHIGGRVPHRVVQGDPPRSYLRLTREGEPCPVSTLHEERGGRGSDAWSIEIDKDGFKVMRRLAASREWVACRGARTAARASGLGASLFQPHTYPQADQDHMVALSGRYMPGYASDVRRNCLLSAYFQPLAGDGKNAPLLEPSVVAEAMQPEFHHLVYNLLTEDGREITALCNSVTHVWTEPTAPPEGAELKDHTVTKDYRDLVASRLTTLFCDFHAMQPADVMEFADGISRSLNSRAYPGAKKIGDAMQQERLKRGGITPQHPSWDATIQAERARRVLAPDFPSDLRGVLAGDRLTADQALLKKADRMADLCTDDLFASLPTTGAEPHFGGIVKQVVNSLASLAQGMQQEEFQAKINPPWVAAVRTGDRNTIEIDARNGSDATVGPLQPSTLMSGVVCAQMTSDPRECRRLMDAFPLGALEMMPEYERYGKSKQWPAHIEEKIEAWIMMHPRENHRRWMRRVFHDMSSVRKGVGGLMDYLGVLARGIYGDTENSLLFLVMGPHLGGGEYSKDAGKSTLRMLHTYMYPTKDVAVYGWSLRAEIQESLMKGGVDLTGSKPDNGIFKLRNKRIADMEESEKHERLHMSTLKKWISAGEENMFTPRKIYAGVQHLRNQLGAMFLYSNFAPEGIEEVAFMTKRLGIGAHHFVVKKYPELFIRVCELDAKNVDWRDPAVAKQHGIPESVRSELAAVGLENCVLPKAIWAPASSLSPERRTEQRNVAQTLAYIALCVGWQVRTKRAGVWPPMSAASLQIRDELFQNSIARVALTQDNIKKALEAQTHILCRPAKPGELPESAAAFLAAIRKTQSNALNKMLKEFIRNRKDDMVARGNGGGLSIDCDVHLPDKEDDPHHDCSWTLANEAPRVDEEVAFYDLLRDSRMAANVATKLPQLLSAALVDVKLPKHGDEEVVEGKVSLPLFGLVLKSTAA